MGVSRQAGADRMSDASSPSNPNSANTKVVDAGLVDTRLENTNVTDVELVVACLRGHNHRFGELYDRYHQPVRSTLFQLCGEEQLDDLTQEVFVRAWKGLKGFRRQAKFSTWLYRIAWNVASDRRKLLAKQRQQRQVLTQAFASASQEGSGGLNQLHHQQLVQEGLQQLSLEHRSVLVLHDLEDLPQKEVAEILGIPVGTVKSRLHNARTTIKRYLVSRGVEL
ncbi:MAG: sigma-70 family RNA polymerase sigma factor [Cyanobacteria bacterium P01_A01_bin.3]